MKVQPVFFDDDGPPSAPSAIPPTLTVGQLEDVLLALKLSALAYTDDANPQDLEQIRTAIGDYYVCEEFEWKLTPLLQYMGYTVDRTFCHKFGQCQGYIAHNGEDIVLAYRGTDSAADWLANIDITTVLFDPQKDLRKILRCGGCCCCFRGGCKRGGSRVHRGLYNALLCSISEIDDVLRPLLQTDEPKRIIITGHSMGGALALGACSYLLNSLDVANTPHKLLFVTAGQPRFGNDRFCEQVENKLFQLEARDLCFAVRITNDRDVVPTIPSSRAGYGHAGRVAHVDDLGEVHMNSDDTGMRKSTTGGGKITECYTDHLPSNYLEAIENALKCAYAKRAQGTKANELRYAGLADSGDRNIHEQLLQ